VSGKPAVVAVTQPRYPAGTPGAPWDSIGTQGVPEEVVIQWNGHELAEVSRKKAKP
jgi:hypothetical protein